LIIVDETKKPGQAIHLGEKIVVVKIRSAMENNDRHSPAGLAIIQTSVFDLCIALAGSRLRVGCICLHK
jgi:hypothetical protein